MIYERYKRIKKKQVDKDLRIKTNIDTLPKSKNVIRNIFFRKF